MADTAKVTTGKKAIEELKLTLRKHIKSLKQSCISAVETFYAESKQQVADTLEKSIREGAELGKSECTETVESWGSIDTWGYAATQASQKKGRLRKPYNVRCG